MVPRPVSPVEVRVRQGPAEPRTPPTPSIESTRAKTITSSTVSLIGVTPAKAALHCETSNGVDAVPICAFWRSPVITVEMRVAASVNACAIAPVGAVPTQRRSTVKPFAGGGGGGSVPLPPQADADAIATRRASPAVRLNIALTASSAAARSA